ncbi:hypothetical protein [Streptomyces sp. B6B3]|uniref:hypothetical protein n=1 Tax=Streptomyces sp. B6B3 TaxID=3153570 RepID=UPI00325CBF05
MHIHGDLRGSAKSLARAGRVDELRRLADGGDAHVARVAGADAGVRHPAMRGDP